MTRFTKAALALGVPLLFGSWLLFRPEKLVLNQVVSESPLPATARLLADGRFVAEAHETSGSAQIYEDQGKRFLRLADFKTSNGPDVHVLLVDRNKNPQTVDLGKLKGNIGDQNYEIPAAVDLDRVSAISIWCKRFGVNFGDATLRRV